MTALAMPDVEARSDAIARLMARKRTFQSVYLIRDGDALVFRSVGDADHSVYRIRRAPCCTFVGRYFLNSGLDPSDLSRDIAEDMLDALRQVVRDGQ